MRECDKNELIALLNKDEKIFVYFYSTFCGTCQVASKIIHALPIKDQVTIHSCNINFMPDIAQALQIESVPCLLIKEKETILEKIYTFHSVRYMYAIIDHYLNK